MPAYKPEFREAAATYYIHQAGTILGNISFGGGTLGQFRLWDSDVTTGTPATADLLLDVVPSAGMLAPFDLWTEGIALSKGLVFQLFTSMKTTVLWRPIP